MIAYPVVERVIADTVSLSYEQGARTMATVKIMYWQDIPYAVRAFDENGRSSKQLPRVFEAAVDEAAMVAGMTEQSDYQTGFRWGEVEERSGAAETVVRAVYDELLAEYSASRLMNMARGRDTE